MAYDLKKLVSSVGKDAASIRALAEKIVSGEYSSPSNKANTLKTWAKTALSALTDSTELVHPGEDDPTRGAWEKARDTRTRLQQQWQGLSKSSRTSEKGIALKAKLDAASDAEDKTMIPANEKGLAAAYRWITGDAQETKAKTFWKDHDKDIARMTEKISNEASNLANTPDRDRGKMDKLGSLAEQYGLDAEKLASIVQTADGSWIPKSHADTDKGVPGGPKPFTPVSTADGMSKTVPVPTTPEGQITTSGAPSSTFYRIGADIYDASTNRKLGPTEWDKDWSGRATQVSAPTDAKPTSSILPEGTNLDGFTADQVKALEDIYSNAGNSPEIMSKVTNLQTISEEDTAKYLAEATDFVGAQYAQTWARASEDFVTSQKYAAEERKVAMAQEAMNKQLATEQAAAQAADAGLATSGIRQKAQARLDENAKNIASSSRRAFAYDQYGAGRKAEDYLGSSVVSGLDLPSIEGSYQAAGGINGSLAQSQAVDTAAKAAALASQSDEINAEVLASQGNVTTR